MPDATPTVGSFLFEYLYGKGIRHAFGIPGDFALPTFRWLENSKIDLITMSHEPSVGFAADAYARVNGLGLCAVTYCVGGLNMLNSIACAYAEKSPVIVLSGGPSPKERKDDPLIHHKVRTFDTQRRIFEEVTCANTILLDAETAPAEINRVVESVIRHCRPGYIEIPYDIVDMPLSSVSYKATEVEVSDRDSLNACVKEAAEKIRNAERPVILAGVELHRHNLQDKASELAQKLNIPIASDMLSKSVIRETNPNYIGVYSGGFSEPGCRDYVDNSDCVIMLGTFITDFFLGLNTAKLDRSNCILVTTEEARVGFHRYDKVVFEDFLDGLLDADIPSRSTFSNPNPAQPVRPLEPKETDEKLTVDDFFRIIGTNMEDGSTIVCDVGDALFGALSLRTSERKNFLADAYYLSMGFAVPAAIGAMANTTGRTFVIVGDGAFQMTGTELTTAAKYGMAPIVFVMNNDGYGTQRMILDGPFNKIHNWNYTKLCDLFGYGKGTQVRTKGELDTAIKAALRDNTLHLIEVMLDKTDYSPTLRRVGESLGEQRDVNKRKKA